jgi:hypothetical protein
MFGNENEFCENCLRLKLITTKVVNLLYNDYTSKTRSLNRGRKGYDVGIEAACARLGVPSIWQAFTPGVI